LTQRETERFISKLNDCCHSRKEALQELLDRSLIFYPELISILQNLIEKDWNPEHRKLSKFRKPKFRKHRFRKHRFHLVIN